MTEASDITRANIWEDGDVVNSGRVQIDGTDVTQAVIASIQRKVFDRSNNSLLFTDAIVVADTIFDTLQTGDEWTEDNDGYNFRDGVPGSRFSTGAKVYRVEYLFIGSSSEKFFVVFEHPAQEVYTS